MCYVLCMTPIAQRELRNRSGEVLRRAEQGEQFIVSVDGRPVAVLGPYRKRQWVSKTEYIGVIRSGPPDETFFDDIIDMGGSRLDLDSRWQR
jgi:prevent-host-death family protein